MGEGMNYVILLALVFMNFLPNNKVNCSKVKLLKPLYVDEVNLPGDFVFNLYWDFYRVDIFGNELDPPDPTLSIDHSLCNRYSNSSDLFRKFAGLFLTTQKENDPFSKIVSTNSWDFCRVTSLFSIYSNSNSFVEVKNVDSYDFNEHVSFRSIHYNRFWSELRLDKPVSINFFVYCSSMALKLKNKYPLLHKSCHRLEQLALAELLIVDLLSYILPDLNEYFLSLHYAPDISGILILSFLMKIDDLRDYKDFFLEFYEISKTFSDDSNFNLLSVSSMNKSVLLEELFQLSVHMNLTFTLELFYFLELVDFESSDTFKFFVSSAKCPIVINRFFDFVPWNSGTIVCDSSRNIPRLHYIYEHQPKLLPMIYSYEPTRINLAISEFGMENETEGKTLLGRILASICSSAFEISNGSCNSSRLLLKEFLNNVKEDHVKLLLSRNPDQDLLNKCICNENEGIKTLFEYVLQTNLSHDTLVNYLKRILLIWKNLEDSNSAVPHAKTFKFLIERIELNSSAEFIPILDEAFEFLKTRDRGLARISSSNSVNSNSSRNSNSRSSSSDLFKTFWFLVTTPETEIPSPPVSPHPTNSNSEIMKFIIMERERISKETDD